MKSVYLDTSSLVKRYVKEAGSGVLDRLYAEAERDNVRLMFSIWNIGEVYGTIDRKQRQGHIPQGSLKQVLQDFIDESRKMSRLDSLAVQPIDTDTLTESWYLTLKHHIFVADALQVSTASTKGADLLLTADAKLLEVSVKEGVKTFNVETQTEEIQGWLAA